MKIKQIAIAGVAETNSTQCEAMILALCEDGSLWITTNRNHPWERWPEPETAPLYDQLRAIQADIRTVREDYRGHVHFEGEQFDARLSAIGVALGDAISAARGANDG